MQNMLQIPWRSIQDATDVPWPKNKLTWSAPFNHTGLDYFGSLWVNWRSREEKGMGLLIHLRCCESRPPRNCKRSNSGGVLVGITKMYCKTWKSWRNHLRQCSSIQVIKIHNWCCMAESHQRHICALVYLQWRNQVVIYHWTITIDGRILWKISGKQ